MATLQGLRGPQGLCGQDIFKIVIRRKKYELIKINLNENKIEPLIGRHSIFMSV